MRLIHNVNKYIYKYNNYIYCRIKFFLQTLFNEKKIKTYIIVKPINSVFA